MSQAFMDFQIYCVFKPWKKYWVFYLKPSVNDSMGTKSSIFHEKFVESVTTGLISLGLETQDLVVCLLSVAMCVLCKVLLLSFGHHLNKGKCHRYSEVREHCGIYSYGYCGLIESAAYWHTFAFPQIQKNQCFLFKNDFIFHRKCLYSKAWWENSLETKRTFSHLMCVCGCFSL